MGSNDPFDFDSPAGSRPASNGPRPASGDPQAAPGRRPVRRTPSRARTNGAATPLSDEQPQRMPPRREPTGAKRPSQPRTPRPTGLTTGGAARDQGGPPPSYAPDRPSQRESGGPRTQVMPAGGGAPPRSVSASSRNDRPGSRPPDAPPTSPRATKPTKRKRRRGRKVVAVLVVLLVLALAWPVGLMIWANGKINHVEALSGDLGTPGTTYLLAGSDSRADGTLAGDTTEGQRTDTIMLLTVPSSGTTSLISLPRDTYVDIPGYGPNKLNAAFSFGGAPLLVETVEQLTGIGVDHYVEIGMGGVAGLVDAVGGVELCLDYVVDDEDSGLVWEEPGCQVVDGTMALAFARMRKADPLGDIGRTERQQQVIQAVTSKVADPSLVAKPGEQVRLVEAGLGALLVSEGTGILDLGRMALAFRNATGEDGVRGAPPIADMDYRPGGVGSSVLLDPDLSPAFFQSVLDGTVTNEDTHSLE